MSPRETRLRERIDALRDERDRMSERLTITEADLAAVRASDDYHGRMILTLRARLREVQHERDEALAALWRERDMTTRTTTAGRGSVIGESAAAGRKASS